MTADAIIAYCLQKGGAYIDYPFGEIPICVKVRKRIFAQIYPRPEDYKITLKCESVFGEFYRQVYPDIVVRGYHCPPIQQPYWNTVHLPGFPDDELKMMIDHAYLAVVHKLPKKEQNELM